VFEEAVRGEAVTELELQHQRLLADHEEYCRRTRDYLEACAKDNTIGCIQRLFGGCRCAKNQCEAKP
jgi:hypothetical protein